MLLAVVSSVLAICSAALPPNPVAASNRDVILTLDLIDKNLVHEYGDSSKQKKAFSLIAEATLLYVTQSADTHEVIRKLHDFMVEPGDIIAADPKKDLDYLRSIIAQPINDIKRACRYDTKIDACIDILEYYYQQQVVRCPEYPNHVELRDRVDKLFQDGDFKRYLQGAIAISRKGIDMVAVAYFIEHQYEEVFDKLRDLYKELSTKNYPCRIYGAYDSMI